MNTNTTLNQRKTLFTTKQLVLISLLSALAYVLQLFHLPFKYLGFLEIEFSDIPAVIAALQFGPLSGIVVELIKNLIKALTASTTASVGELANFLISSAYIIPVGILYKFRKNKTTDPSNIVKSKIFLIIMFSFATICFATAGAIVNYFITVPLYAKLFGGMDAVIGFASASLPAIKSLGALILIGITPFNIVKGIAMSVLGYYVYYFLRNVLSR